MYGLTIDSDIPLALSPEGCGELGHVELCAEESVLFELVSARARIASRPNEWCRYGFLPDDSTYVRWDGVGEFLVSPDGRHIAYRRFDEASFESFHVYMLGQALSFALIRFGFEPLHATAVVIDGRAAAFLGRSGLGKSTLAAGFIENGFPVLTDDVLVVRDGVDGLMVYPGPSRIKLFPKVAGSLLRGYTMGVPMNTDTKKRILPLEHHHRYRDPVRLGGIYALVPPRELRGHHAVRLEVMTPRAAAIALIGGTFNSRVVGSARLTRQFAASTTLADRVPVKRLWYPRVLSRLPDVVKAIAGDLRHPEQESLRAPREV